MNWPLEILGAVFGFFVAVALDKKSRFGPIKFGLVAALFWSLFVLLLPILYKAIP